MLESLHMRGGEGLTATETKIVYQAQAAWIQDTDNGV